jgi:hypothetical protein
MAAVVPGRLVMLDEPTNDVDPVRRRLLWMQVRASRRQRRGSSARDAQRHRGGAIRGPLAILDEGQGHRRGDAGGAQGPPRRRASAGARGRPATETPVSPFGRSVVPVGNRLMVGVPMDAAGPAVGWAEMLQREPARSRNSPSARQPWRTFTWRWSTAASPARRRLEEASMQALRSYELLVTWQALRKKAYLPLMMAVQALFSLGIVLGYPLLFPDPGPDDDLPDRHRRARPSPWFPSDLWHCPRPSASSGPRAASRICARCRCRASPTCRRPDRLARDRDPGRGSRRPRRCVAVRTGPQVSPMVVPAVLMVALTATCVGYALASVLPYMLTVIVTQAIVVLRLHVLAADVPARQAAGLARDDPQHPADPGHGRGDSRHDSRRTSSRCPWARF